MRVLTCARKVAAALLCAFLFAVPVHALDGALTLLHTNDMRGHFMQLMKVSAVKNQVKSEKGNVLLLDAGNSLSDHETAFSHPDGRVSPTVDLMNRAGYDALTLGERELTIDRDGLTRCLREAEFPVLGSNLHRPETGRPLFQVQPYAVLRSGGIRVGVLGLASGGRDVLVGDPLAAARYYVPLLRERADIVVLLTHQAYDVDSTLAADVQGIDVIIGTHSEAALSGRREVNGVPIRQAGPDGGFVGRIDLLVAEGQVSVVNSQLVPLDVALGAEMALTSALSSWMLPVQGKPVSVMSVLGNSAGGFGASVGQAGAMGYLLADLMRSETGADIALVSARSIDSELAEGPVRVLDLYRIYAPDHRVGVVDMTGEDLRELMEQGLEDLHAFFYPSGIEVTFDLSKPAGSRLVGLALEGHQPINLRKTFRVAVEAGIGRFQEAARASQGVALRDILARHLQQAEVIRGRLDDRLREP